MNLNDPFEQFRKNKSYTFNKRTSSSAGKLISFCSAGNKGITLSGVTTDAFISPMPTIDQLQRECLSHEYHYPAFWWSKSLVVIVCRVLDNEAINIEAH